MRSSRRYAAREASSWLPSRGAILSHAPRHSRSLQAYDEVTSTLILKFSFRPKAKHFALDSPASCRAVCQLLGRLLDGIDNGTELSYAELFQQGAADAAENGGDAGKRGALSISMPPPLQTSSPGGAAFGDGEVAKGAPSTPTTPTTPTAQAPQPPPPEWLVGVFERAGCRDFGELAYGRLRSGWCCRKYGLEATLFGVLMPLATAGYWLSEANGLGAETGKTDENGKTRWLAAECDVNNLLVVPRQVYHHGKFADAKDVAYQEGRVWRLEPAYNASVVLKQTLYADGHPTFRDWPVSWWVSLHTTPSVSQRPHCDGQVLQASHEVRQACANLHEWIPEWFLRLNWGGKHDVSASRTPTPPATPARPAPPAPPALQPAPHPNAPYTALHK